MRRVFKGIGALGLLLALWGCAPAEVAVPGADTAGSAVARVAGPEDPRPQPRPGDEKPPSGPAAVVALAPPATPGPADAPADAPARQGDPAASGDAGKPEPKLPDSLLARPEAPPVPPALRAQAAQCESGKGRFTRRGGAGTYVCVRPTRDANQSCNDSSECDGICFAKSRTCAPVEPLFGCYDALEGGRVVNLCVQ